MISSKVPLSLAGFLTIFVCSCGEAEQRRTQGSSLNTPDAPGNFVQVSQQWHSYLQRFDVKLNLTSTRAGKPHAKSPCFAEQDFQRAPNYKEVLRGIGYLPNGILHLLRYVSINLSSSTEVAPAGLFIADPKLKEAGCRRIAALYVNTGGSAGHFASETVVHEIGHLVDYVARDAVHETDAFDPQHAVTEYGRGSKYEAFAEAFSLFFRNQRKFKIMAATNKQWAAQYDFMLNNIAMPADGKNYPVVFRGDAKSVALTSSELSGLGAVSWHRKCHHRHR